MYKGIQKRNQVLPVFSQLNSHNLANKTFQPTHLYLRKWNIYHNPFPEYWYMSGINSFVPLI